MQPPVDEHERGVSGAGSVFKTYFKIEQSVLSKCKRPANSKELKDKLEVH